MKRIWGQVALLALAICAAAYADSYWARQCRNFETNEQPYLYLYTNSDYGGDPLYVTNASVPDLGALPIKKVISNFFDDKASSMRIRGKWQVCTGKWYSGSCVVVGSTDWKSELAVPNVKGAWGADFDDSISSFKLLSCNRF